MKSTKRITKPVISIVHIPVANERPITIRGSRDVQVVLQRAARAEGQGRAVEVVHPHVGRIYATRIFKK